MKIQNLEFSVHTVAASSAVQFVLHRNSSRNEIIGIYRPEEKLWLCPLAFPNHYWAPLSPDRELATLRTILFLAGADDIDGCISTLETYAEEYQAARRKHHAA